MNKYESEEWRAKSLSILYRDNFTCQNCDAFNPALGPVQLNSPINGDVEIHEYDNKHESIYKISSQHTGLTIEIDLGTGLWIVPPIMQVHHKCYIEGKEIWEYDDDDLITYCKDCHTNHHNNNKIDIYNAYGTNVIRSQFCEIKYTDSDKDRKHNFKPWTIIDKNGNEYSQVSVIKPTLRYFVFQTEFNDEELRSNARNMLQEFFQTYLPSYKHT